ncbi:hypothetical protein ACQ86N_24960 [Puia sp. P3]|uniref:hypothetical protein n=1 Tax=Puia sp. P3 TaxID=3423952 RepID=UPI003D678A0F
MLTTKLVTIKEELEQIARLSAANQIANISAETKQKKASSPGSIQRRSLPASTPSSPPSSPWTGTNSRATPSASQKTAPTSTLP